MKRIVKRTLGIVMSMALCLPLAGSMSVQADEEYDLSLYSIQSSNENFDEWLEAVEKASGLNIEVVPLSSDGSSYTQKATTILSTADKTVDIVEMSDEMTCTFRNTGWLVPLNDTIMTEDIVPEYHQGYLAAIPTNARGEIVALPLYTGYFALFVNRSIMDEVGIDQIDTKEDFLAYMEAVSGDGRYGYGGAWEVTQAFNELAQFVNMFGGDYFDWTNPANKEAVQFMYDMVQNGYTTTELIGDKYDQQFVKMNDDKYGLAFAWGIGDAYDEDVEMAMIPDFTGTGLRPIFTDSWSYGLNAASERKEAAETFLKFMTTEEAQKLNFEFLYRYPPRKDFAETIVPADYPVKEAYRRYEEECVVQGRPIPDDAYASKEEMGALFQQCMKGEITVDDFCEKAQECMDTYTE